MLNTYFPVGRRWIEQWVTRLKRDLFPDQDWFACQALREDFEARVPAKQALQTYWMRRYMRLRKHAMPWLRQLVTYGTSPVRNVWRCVEHEQTVLRDVLADDGTPSGKTIEQVEKVADFLGPTFEPVDLFAFYVWPPTAAGLDDATLVFEDRCVPRSRVYALASKPLDPSKFMPWLQNLVQTEGQKILRSKGILAFTDDDDRYVFQGVHMMLEGDHQRKWRNDEKRESRVVFIGRELPEQAIREGFEKTIA